MIARAFNTAAGNAQFNAACDLTGDGYINIADLVKLALRFGYTYDL